MSRSVLLLRAVNVSGRNRVPMAELRALLAPLLGPVSTYIASGNVVCEHPSDPVAARAEVRKRIAAEFDVDTPVILRTHDELAAALAANPFPDAALDKMVHVLFLEADAAPDAIETLTPKLGPHERLALVGRDLWIDYGEGGAASTKLATPVFNRALGTTGTARNLLTLRKLVALTA